MDSAYKYFYKNLQLRTLNVKDFKMHKGCIAFIL